MKLSIFAVISTLLICSPAFAEGLISSLDDTKTALKEVVADRDNTTRYKEFIEKVDAFYIENAVQDGAPSPEVIAEANSYKRLLTIFVRLLQEDKDIQDAGVKKFQNSTEQSVIPGFKKGFAFSHNQSIDAYWIGRANTLSKNIDEFVLKIKKN